MLYPLTFHPIFKERVWGGRNLEQLYKKPLPADRPIGESWEISDRDGDVSIIANGPFEGRDIRWLMQNHGAEILGREPIPGERFPLLIKLLDARDVLSLQVHPPAHKAAVLKGEPKTEMWYIARAEPGAQLYVGLRRGTTKRDFEQCLREGSVADCFHRISVKTGDTMFLPSGRVHALGAGLVIFEIQQNSDTTYRVFDWNRKGLDGKLRDLHIIESLESIDFDDFEPALVHPEPFENGGVCSQPLVRDELFNVDLLTASSERTVPFRESRLRVIGAVEGSASVSACGRTAKIESGGFCLVPASAKNPCLSLSSHNKVLVTELAV
jgi:mannose-6-phosphate isomerase